MKSGHQENNSNEHYAEWRWRLTFELLVPDRRASSTRPLREVASLAHEPFDDPMENRILVVQRLLGLLRQSLFTGAKASKILNSVGTHATKQLKHYASSWSEANVDIEPHLDCVRLPQSV